MKNQFGFYLTDQQFADKWKEFPSPTLMANEIKMSPRAVQNRRRSVEIRLGVKLETLVDLRAEHNKNQKEKLINISANPSIKKNCKAPDVCHPSPTKAKGNPQ